GYDNRSGQRPPASGDSTASDKLLHYGLLFGSKILDEQPVDQKRFKQNAVSAKSGTFRGRGCLQKNERGHVQFPRREPFRFLQTSAGLRFELRLLCGGANQGTERWRGRARFL